MKILRNKEGEIIYVKGDLEEKVLSILGKSRKPVRFTDLVVEVYGSYDDSKRISLLRVINRLNDKGLVEKVKVGVDLYVRPVFSEVRILYYTSIIIPYLMILNLASVTLALLIGNPYAAYIALYYILGSSSLLFAVYLLERKALNY